MCRLRNIAMRDYQESVTTGQTHGQTDAGQSDPYVPLCFAGNTKTNSTTTKYLLGGVGIILAFTGSLSNVLRGSVSSPSGGDSMVRVICP